MVMATMVYYGLLWLLWFTMVTVVYYCYCGVQQLLLHQQLFICSLYTNKHVSPAMTLPVLFFLSLQAIQPADTTLVRR